LHFFTFLYGFLIEISHSLHGGGGSGLQTDAA
jgi:hypothetical protein